MTARGFIRLGYFFGVVTIVTFLADDTHAFRAAGTLTMVFMFAGLVFERFDAIEKRLDQIEGREVKR